jgi:hypothetical protein
MVNNHSLGENSPNLVTLAVMPELTVTVAVVTKQAQGDILSNAVV